MALYFDRNGEPMEMMEWAEAFESQDRAVAKDTVGGIDVSTVYLGIDHSFGQGPPLIFETMVFNHGRSEEYQWRYSTEEGARTGHARILAWVREGMVGGLDIEEDRGCEGGERDEPICRIENWGSTREVKR